MRILRAWILVVLVGWPAALAIGGGGSGQRDDGEPPLGQARPPADDEQPSGLWLAERHLPELLPVLNYLRDHQPEQYDTALSDLERAAKRLEVQRRRGQAHYRVALARWRTQGAIDLLKARLKVRHSEADARQLLAEMQRLQQIDLRRLTLDAEALKRREATLRQRAEQAEKLAQRAGQQRDELLQRIEQMRQQQVDTDSPAYRRAVAGNRTRNSQSRDEPSSTSNP